MLKPPGQVRPPRSTWAASPVKPPVLERRVHPPVLDDPNLLSLSLVCLPVRPQKQADQGWHSALHRTARHRPHHKRTTTTPLPQATTIARDPTYTTTPATKSNGAFVASRHPPSTPLHGIVGLV